MKIRADTGRNEGDRVGGGVRPNPAARAPMKTRWLFSNGGPWLLLPAAVASSWGGYGPDYKWACTVHGWVVTFGRVGRDALIFGDEAYRTAVDPLGRTALVQCYLSPDFDAAVRAIGAADLGELPLLGIAEGSFPRGRYVMFESTLTLDEARADGEVLELELSRDYAVCEYRVLRDEARDVQLYVITFA